MKETITYQLLLELSKRPMKYSEMQRFVYFLGKGKRAENVNGWWCTNLGNLFESGAILFLEGIGYYSNGEIDFKVKRGFHRRIFDHSTNLSNRNLGYYKKRFEKRIFPEKIKQYILKNKPELLI